MRRVICVHLRPSAAICVCKGRLKRNPAADTRRCTQMKPKAVRAYAPAFDMARFGSKVYPKPRTE